MSLKCWLHNKTASQSANPSHRADKKNSTCKNSHLMKYVRPHLETLGPNLGAGLVRDDKDKLIFAGRGRGHCADQRTLDLGEWG